MSKTLKITLISIASVVTLFFLLIFSIQYFFSVSVLRGISMQPTFYDGDMVLVRRYSIPFNKELERGTIISFAPPGTNNYTLVKRIVGLPGDEIKIKDGKVYINGEVLVEDYIQEGIETTGQVAFPHRSLWVVPQGEVFVLGDNRRLGASDDSRNFGTIKKSDVLGIVIYTLPKD